MTRATWIVALAAALAIAACAQIEKLPGGAAASSYVKDRTRENTNKITDNTVNAVASGQFNKSSTFSMQQEFHLGRSVAANVISRLGGRALRPENPVAMYVRDVGTVVALASAEGSSAGDRPYPWKGFHFIVADAPQVNAVGMPSGFVVVTTGALRAVRSEDELAAILAHEIAHVQRGHAMAPVEGARQQEHITSTMLAGTDPVVHVFFGKVVTLGTDFVLDKGYGKTNELDADAVAFATLKRAGYDPRALERFLGRLEGAAAEGGFFSRHPPAADRVAALQGTSQAITVAASPGNPRQARFDARIKAALQ